MTAGATPAPPRARARFILRVQHVAVGIWFAIWMTVLTVSVQRLGSVDLSGVIVRTSSAHIWLPVSIAMLLLPVYVQVYYTIKEDMDGLRQRARLPREPEARQAADVERDFLKRAQE